MERLNQKDNTADSMEWNELRQQTITGSRPERREARRILQRRLALSVSPLVFALLAGTLGLRVRRGGRGIGVLLSLLVVIVYYLISLMGESLARVGSVSAVVGEWMATAFMLMLSLIFLIAHRAPLLSWISSIKGKKQSREGAQASSTAKRRTRLLGIGARGFPSLLDVTVFRTLVLSFLLGFFALAAVFNIFTLFELWRFIAMTQASAVLVGRYLLFLLPLIAVELFPSTMLISVLITYALLARRHEAIAWWACGQSVYRLMVPGVVFALAIGAGSWLVQEQLMPSSNLKQDALRARIKGGDARAIT
jgi:lipopolysaccharide export LptBFGC system permease protein LptF